MDLSGMGLGSMEWLDLAQDKEQWRALENTEQLLASPEGLSSMELVRSINEGVRTLAGRRACRDFNRNY
jgi:hypothetical protein